MWMTPAFFTAASICSASLTVFASGFSQNTTLPALAAAIAISAWLSPGVAMSTMSMSLRRDDLAPVGGGFFPAELRRRGLHVRRASGRRSPSSAASVIRREEPGHLALRVAVRPAHEGVADQCDVQRVPYGRSVRSRRGARGAPVAQAGSRWWLLLGGAFALAGAAARRLVERAARTSPAPGSPGRRSAP